MQLFRATLATPVGPMLALASDEGLYALEFDAGSRMSRLDARLARFLERPTLVDRPNAIVERTREWLDAYFAGTSADIGTLPLTPAGSPFELRVWAALRQIPPGETRSYGQVAAQVAATINASRAVGLANGSNPIAIIVPCHRVIGADGSLTGYGGGLSRKTWLLEHEGRFWPTDTSIARVAPRARSTRGRAHQSQFDF